MTSLSSINVYCLLSHLALTVAFLEFAIGIFYTLISSCCPPHSLWCESSLWVSNEAKSPNSLPQSPYPLGTSCIIYVFQCNFRSQGLGKPNSRAILLRTLVLIGCLFCPWAFILLKYWVGQKDHLRFCYIIWKTLDELFGQPKRHNVNHMSVLVLNAQTGKCYTSWI